MHITHGTRITFIKLVAQSPSTEPTIFSTHKCKTVKFFIESSIDWWPLCSIKRKCHKKFEAKREKNRIAQHFYGSTHADQPRNIPSHAILRLMNANKMNFTLHTRLCGGWLGWVGGLLQ